MRKYILTNMNISYREAFIGKRQIRDYNPFDISGWICVKDYDETSWNENLPEARDKEGMFMFTSILGNKNMYWVDYPDALHADHMAIEPRNADVQVWINRELKAAIYVTERLQEEKVFNILEKVSQDVEDGKPYGRIKIAFLGKRPMKDWSKPSSNWIFLSRRSEDGDGHEWTPEFLEAAYGSVSEDSPFLPDSSISTFKITERGTIYCAGQGHFEPDEDFEDEGIVYHYNPHSKKFAWSERDYTVQDVNKVLAMIDGIEWEEGKEIKIQ